MSLKFGSYVSQPSHCDTRLLKELRLLLRSKAKADYRNGVLINKSLIPREYLPIESKQYAIILEFRKKNEIEKMIYSLDIYHTPKKSEMSTVRKKVSSHSL